MANDTFIGIRNLERDMVDEDEDLYEPAEVIAARVIFALLVSVALVLNLLLLLAVARRSRKRRSSGVQVVYWLACSFLIPDLVFYTKLALEMANWGQTEPDWAKSDASCAAWQFATHWYPLAYSVLLLAIVYHAFVTLFLDYTGGYEKSCRKFLPLILAAILIPTLFMVAPSAIYSAASNSNPNGASLSNASIGIVNKNQYRSSHFRQYCQLEVPPLLGTDTSAVPQMAVEATAAYRLCYEVILPFVAPLCFLMFPYVCLLLGLMRGMAAASHADIPTKMSVVVTLWLVTTYLMFHVASLLRSLLGVLSVWHRLVAMFDAYDDERVPRFQTYIHMVSYALTCVWAIARAALCFKYNVKLRKALGP